MAPENGGDWCQIGPFKIRLLVEVHMTGFLTTEPFFLEKIKSDFKKTG